MSARAGAMACPVCGDAVEWQIATGDWYAGRLRRRVLDLGSARPHRCVMGPWPPETDTPCAPLGAGGARQGAPAHPPAVPMRPPAPVPAAPPSRDLVEVLFG